MSANKDVPVTPETMRALLEVMRNPRRCCNDDTVFFVANAVLRRETKLTYANVPGLTEREAQTVLDFLKELFPDQRDEIRFRAAQTLPGPS